MGSTKSRNRVSIAILLASGVMSTLGCGSRHDVAPQPETASHNVLARVISPGVFCREDPTDAEGKELPLDPERPTLLPAGRAWVRCSGGGKLAVYLPGEVKVYTAAEWEAVPYIADSRQRDLYVQRLQIIFRQGGRDRGTSEGPVILSPASGHFICPSSFVLCWRPFPADTRIDLSVIDPATQRSLWAKTVDGRVGTFVSPDLRDAIVAWRAGENGKRRLSVVLRAGQNVHIAEVVVLSADREGELQRELNLWEEDAVSAGLMRHLGRSASFHAYDLAAEACDTAEEALKVAPTDPLVRQTAAAANALVGNTSRSREIEDQSHRP